jgi:hypothetical protein
MYIEYIMEIPKIIPEAPVVRISGKNKGTKYYVVKCPYCEHQHYHAMRGGLGNRGRHCIDIRFMKHATQRRFLRNCVKYGDCGTYDIVNPSLGQCHHASPPMVIA